MQFAGGIKAPLYYVSSGQVNLLVPWELANQAQTSLTATLNGQSSTAQSVALSTFSPGIFSMNGQGTGQGAILDTSYRLVDPTNPATAGSTYIQIYCTGLGPVSNQPVSGSVSPSGPLAGTTTTPVVTIGGIPAQVTFSGLAPGFVGEYQVNALIPTATAPGDAVPVTISAGGKTSNGVTIAIRAATGGVPTTLSSVYPSSGSAGKVFTVALTAANSGFVQGRTLASFGPGISVSGAPEGQPGVLTVASSTTATATITIDPLAAMGPRTVTVTTGGQTASLNNAFTVLPPPASMPDLAVTSTVPANKATGISLAPIVQIVFNEPLDPSTIGPSTVGISNGANSLPTMIVYDSAKYVISLAPKGSLLPGTTYTVSLGTALRNAVEDPLVAPYSFSFTTIPPIAVTGTITPSPGIDPKTLTVLSYGGKTSTPDGNGNFSAALNPTGNTLVAAVFPGKTFALLAVLTNGSVVPVKASVADGRTGAFALPASQRVHVTPWQVTGSYAATASPNPVMDFQTTAEALLFASPYFYTADSTKSTLMQPLIAGSPFTSQLAATLQAKMTGANALAHPMTDSSVQSAMQSATQDVLKSVLSLSGPFAVPTTANSTPATMIDPCTPPNAPSTFPATVKITPYCKNGVAPSSGDLPCLDLDYISFCNAVTAIPTGYAFKPVNCSSKSIGGCAVGWLARVSPITDGADPSTITAVQIAGVSQSPSGHTSPCGTNAPCYGAWIPSDSWAGKADVFGAFSDWVTGLILAPLIGDTSGSLVLPTAPGNYIARFYSGGVSDVAELSRVNDYTDGKKLNDLAASINFAETALNSIDVFVSATDAITAGAGSAVDPKKIAKCAIRSMTQAAIENAAGNFIAGSPTDLNGGAKAVAGIGASMLNNAASSCGVSEAVGSFFKFGAEALLASTGVGVIVDVAAGAAAAAGNAAEALQRSYELQHSASAVESAVVEILAGSGIPNNPVPKIISLAPSSAPVGGSPPTVTIKGSSFLENCTVFANNAKRSFKHVDSGTLTFDLSTSDLSTAGTFSVAVRNPGPGGGTSSSVFMVTSGTSSNPAPLITSITPSAVVVGATPPAVSIMGHNFLSNSTVTIGGSLRQVNTPSDAGLLTIPLSTLDVAKVASLAVVVTNPGPGGGSSTYNSFTVMDSKPSLPGVTAISTPQRQYVVGDQFELDYAVWADPASTSRYDLMITVRSLASGTTYYYYDNASDSNRWLHTSPRGAVQNSIPKPGSVPPDPSQFPITSDVPSGEYHVKAYFSAVGANVQVGVAAETDFSVATDTSAGNCFVATAAFGSSMARQVQYLRAFRDRILVSATAGRAFVNWYYTWSPRAAAWLRVHAVARKLTRAMLWVPVAFAWLSLRTNVVLASLGFLVMFVSLGWGLRRGPAWWRVLCLLVLAIGVASAQPPGREPSLIVASATPPSESFSGLRSRNLESKPCAPASTLRFQHSPLGASTGPGCAYTVVLASK
jgi:uncharacterized protein (TIGR03437 family)